MRFFALPFFAALVMLGSAASADTLRAPFRIVDGDTFFKGRTYYRIQNMDAPEKACRAAFDRASRRLGELLAPPARVTFYRRGHDRYGRTMVRVLAKGHPRGFHKLGKSRDVAAIMVAEGLAVRASERTGFCPK